MLLLVITGGRERDKSIDTLKGRSASPKKRILK